MFQRVLLFSLCLVASPWAWGQAACWGQKVTDGKAIYGKLQQLKSQILNDQYQDQKWALQKAVHKEWAHINDNGLYDSNISVLQMMANSIIVDGFYLYALPVNYSVVQQQFNDYQSLRAEVKQVLSEYAGARADKDSGLIGDYLRLLKDYQNLSSINYVQLSCADQKQSIQFIDAASGVKVSGPLQNGVTYRAKLSSLIAEPGVPAPAELFSVVGKIPLYFQATSDPREFVTESFQFVY